MVRVSRVLPNSIAQELGIVPGTELHSVNGRELDDFLDWEFLTADDALTIEARAAGRGGDRLRHRTPRRASRSASSSSRPRSGAAPTAASSASSRDFPTGLRRSLYIRDDDYRLSFAYGNFATLSNVKERDVARILEYRLSPLYVSVHATPWDARKSAAEQSARARTSSSSSTTLAEGGIQFHAPDGDRARAQRRRGARAVASPTSGRSATRCSPWRSCRSGSRSSRTCTPGESMDAAACGALLDHVDRWASRALGRSAASAGCTVPTSCTCSPGVALPAAVVLRRLSRRSRTVSGR